MSHSQSKTTSGKPFKSKTTKHLLKASLC
jgi:hypothetical protein